MLSCLSARRGWLARLTFVQDVVEGPLLTWRAQGTEPNPRPMRACTGARCRVPRHHTSDHLVLILGGTLPTWGYSRKLGLWPKRRWRYCRKLVTGGVRRQR